ncbi:MAG: hypothetical protein B7Y39_14065 [Bdellovibrio sp. 28-41-41]|nr:MAG: hypothetical protein B7Y39_14065 [Bdellovibrio sp. 28-41-41]
MLELKNVYKSYGEGGQQQSVLEDVSVVFDDNQFIALLGKSGSGKSTILNILSGLDCPDKGSVIFSGKSLYDRLDSELSQIRRIYFGFIFQSFNLLSNLTAYENIEYPLYLLKLSSTERRRRTLDILDHLQLTQFQHKLPGQLSGGQRQRVAIGRALVKSPKYIFADEPTANLDEKTGHEIIELIKEMQKYYGTTIIYVTHDSEITEVADKCLFLTNRKIEKYVHP